MNTKKFSDALGNIDEIYIDEAISYKSKRKNNFWLKFGSVAACLAVVLTAGITLPALFGEDGPTPPTPPIDDNVIEKYYDYGVDGGVFSVYTGGNVIMPDKIGNVIESVTVTAGWKNADGEWLNTENLKAQIYSIEGVSSSTAAALKFIDKGEAVTTSHYYVITHPNAQYNGMLFPDYKAENPVRYLEETSMGKANGWQDFGTKGEIRTITVPMGSTYVYQMYSYYIRNDLSHIYADEELPDKLEDLPRWLTDTMTVGRRSFWYSMGGRLPKSISLEATSNITSEDGGMQFIKSEYKTIIDGNNGEKEESWVIYFMEENGVYSAYAVVTNDDFDFVKSYTETIVKSYKQK